PVLNSNSNGVHEAAAGFRNQAFTPPAVATIARWWIDWLDDLRSIPPRGRSVYGPWSLDECVIDKATFHPACGSHHRQMVD
ncbi:MAG: hypothetical protein ACK523_01160, partial [Pirellulaceae bacterium]